MRSLFLLLGLVAVSHCASLFNSVKNPEWEQFKVGDLFKDQMKCSSQFPSRRGVTNCELDKLK